MIYYYIDRQYINNLSKTESEDCIVHGAMMFVPEYLYLILKNKNVI